MKTLIKHNFSYELILALVFSAVIGMGASLALSALVMLLPAGAQEITQQTPSALKQKNFRQINISSRYQDALKPAVFVSEKKAMREMVL